MPDQNAGRTYWHHLKVRGFADKSGLPRADLDSVVAGATGLLDGDLLGGDLRLAGGAIDALIGADRVVASLLSGVAGDLPDPGGLTDGLAAGGLPDVGGLLDVDGLTNGLLGTDGFLLLG